MTGSSAVDGFSFLSGSGGELEAQSARMVAEREAPERWYMDDTVRWER